MAKASLEFNRRAVRTPSDGLSEEALVGADISTHAEYRPITARLADDGDAMQRAFFVSMKHKEQWLMEKAFCSTLSRPDPYPQCSRQDLIDSLVEDYRVFSIASGRHSAVELIRGLETAAIQQASDVTGQAR